MSEPHDSQRQRTDIRCKKGYLDEHLKKVLVDEDGSIWVAFNALYLPKRQSSRMDTLKDGLVPRFYTEELPYICAMLDPCALSGDFLETFCLFDVIPIDGQYSLARSKIAEWQLYEVFTFKLIESLLPFVTTTLDFSLPVLPFRLGYSETERTAARVINRARRARLAFCYLFGMATYLLALVPDWMKIALRAELPEQWLRALESSPIANFSITEGRIGAFFDFSRSAAELRNLPVLIRKNIPLWIFWGDGTNYRPPLEDKFEIRIAELLGPSDEEVRLAKAENSRVDDGSGSSFQPDVNDESTFWIYDDGPPVAPTKRSSSLEHVSSVSQSIAYPVAASEDLSPSSGPVISLKETGDALRSIETNLPPVEPYSGYVCFQPGQVERGSRQLPLESPNQFWARQRADDEEKLGKMPEQERKRLRNERDGNRITKKSKVFHWEKFPWGYVRRRVGRKEIDDYLEYPPTQTRFSVTRNEWDICSDFDPDAEPSFSYPDSDDSCDFPKPKRQASGKKADCQTHPRKGVPAENRSSIPEEVEEGDEEGEILESDRIPLHSDSIPPDVAIFFEKRFQEALKCRYKIRAEIKVREMEDVSLDKMLYYRYGLSIDRVHSLVPTDKKDVSDRGAEQAWATARGIFYDVESSIDKFALKEMLGVTEFVRLLLENIPVPASVLDIHPDNFFSPIAKEMKRVAHTLNIQKSVLDRVVYLLRPKDLEVAIALEDPSLVVEVLRRGVHSLFHGKFSARDLPQLFARRGSPFRTLCLVKEPGIKLQPMPWDLGYRTCHEEPGAFAYAQYEKLLQIFMRQPRARCVFGLGGSVWRAVSEVHGISADQVTGPSEDVGTFGRSFVLPDGHALWEDALTESDLLFLCGTYKVRKGNDVMLYSWWPTPRQWEVATSNVRYWSPGNERWFMSRLHDIRNGRATWVHVPKWSQKLKTNKKTKRLMNKNSDLCEQFLESSEYMELPLEQRSYQRIQLYLVSENDV